MSKQDIEKRLGFAAQGVKETTRTSAKAEMGFLSRVGYAATALTADPADPKSAEYRKQVSEAKAAAKDAITNYKFMRDKVKERLAALDAYVTNAIKVINSATSAKDIEHYVEQLRIAVKSQSMILGASKSPFSRPGVKAKMAFPSASTASSRTEELLRKELSRIAGEGYIQYKGRSRINSLKSKSDFLQMISDLRSYLAPLQKKWVSKSEQEQDAAGSLETSSALNTISGALKKLDQLMSMANGVTTAARPGVKAKA